MKTHGQKNRPARTRTLADLVATVSKLTRDERLGAYIVADMINSDLVRFEGRRFHGRRVIVG